MIKLIVTDLDNTLLDSNKSIPETTKNVIQKAKLKCVPTVIATGRSFLSAKNISDEIGLFSPIICYNGAMIRDYNGDVIFESYLDKKLVKELIDYCDENNLYIQLYHNNEIIVKKKRLDLHDDPDMKYANCREVDKFDVSSISSPKMLIASNCSSISLLFNELLDKFGDRAYFTRSDSHLIEIMPPGINKGSALTFLMKEYGLKKEEVMACGDNYNDKLLLENAGLKVAVANAVVPLKNMANYICINERSLCIEEVINKFIL